MSTVSLPDHRLPGATDDNAALAAALAAGDRVYLPAGEGTGPNGEYQIGAEPGTFSMPLAGNFPANSYLFGDGIGKTVVKQTGTYVFLANSLSADLADNIANLVIKDMTLENDVVELGFLAASIMINLGGVSNFLAERVEFRGFRGDGLYIGSSPFTGTGNERHNENVTVRDCIFNGINRNNRNGISVIDCHGWLFENIEFRHCTAPGMPGPIDLEPIEPDPLHPIENPSLNRIRNGRIENCRFIDNGGNAISVLLLPNSQVPEPYENIAISGCTIEDSAGAFSFSGFTGDQAATATDAYHVSFTDNFVKNTPSPFHIGGAFGLTIARNHFEDADLATLDARTNRNVSIVDNVFVRCGTTNGPVIVQDGSAANVDISGNTFRDCGKADGSFGPIFYLRGLSTYADWERLNRNRIESPSSPVRTTVFAAVTFDPMHTIDVRTTCQKTGNEFIGFTPANPDNFL